MVTQTRVTVEEFDRIAALSENADKRLEFIGGEIVEVGSNNYASEVAATVLAAIGIYVKRNNLGRVTGADGSYKVSGERYIPDVAFISRARQPEPCYEAYNPNAPDLAIEVVSPTDQPSDVTDKVANYLAAGTIVWVFHPDKREAKVYQPGQPVQTITRDDTLNGGDVLPGFTLRMRDVFEE